MAQDNDKYFERISKDITDFVTLADNNREDFIKSFTIKFKEAIKKTTKGASKKDNEIEKILKEQLSSLYELTDESRGINANRSIILEKSDQLKSAIKGIINLEGYTNVSDKKVIKSYSDITNRLTNIILPSKKQSPNNKKALSRTERLRAKRKTENKNFKEEKHKLSEDIKSHNENQSLYASRFEENQYLYECKNDLTLAEKKIILKDITIEMNLLREKNLLKERKDIFSKEKKRLFKSKTKLERKKLPLRKKIELKRQKSLRMNKNTSPSR